MLIEPASELVRARLVAVIRTKSAEAALLVARAALAGGIDALEVTTSVPGWPAVVSQLAREVRLVGVGTLFEPEDCLTALAAGARFVVSPAGRSELVAPAHQAGAACALGGITPTEVDAVRRAGADLIKVFPADAAGGAGLIKSLRAVFPEVVFMPTGGITADTIAGYLSLDRVVLGIGGWLAPAGAIAGGDAAEITRRARLLVAQAGSGGH
ncbi:2-dehydro-3-deoxyphosphogluconate aldolase [bacterium]|nr:MAG: 2-dehydro-3-deoxyphosphogluconate aldolase [bacterium]